MFMKSDNKYWQKLAFVILSLFHVWIYFLHFSYVSWYTMRECFCLFLKSTEFIIFISHIISFECNLCILYSQVIDVLKSIKHPENS